LVNLSCILLPQRFILGGGIMHQPRLLPLVRQRVQELLNGYLQVPLILDKIEEYIVSPGLGDRAGVLGALALAQQAGAQQAGAQ
jgi:fructokinase